MRELIHHWLSDTAAGHPERIAIDWDGTRTTYRELDAWANRIAHTLREHDVYPGDRVAFCIPKSHTAIAGMLGILKAGAVYVPIDADSPAARATKVLDACRPRCVLGIERTLPLLQQAAATLDSHLSLARLDSGDGHETAFDADVIAAAAADAPDVPRQATDAAHILFTSGSTGVPKGVVITHANVRAFVAWGIEYFGITARDRVSGHAPLHFDLSTFDIYAALATGAELHPVPPTLNLLPHKVAAFIRDRRLTQWFSVPSILNYLAKFDVVRPGDFPDLRRLMWCGEVLSTPTLRYLMQRLPHVQFTNLYGPTEATIASSYYTVTSPLESHQETVPIGLPCAGEQLFVLDDQLQSVPEGEIGDLYIAGVGLSPGYWQDADKTAAAFLPSPLALESGERIYRTGDLAKIDEQGLIHFLGRADTQIKSRGYRIELGEIETALATLDVLKESAVVAIDTDGFENKLICGALVPSADCSCEIPSVRTELGRLVPRYMLPTQWLILEALPRNANGKVDRPALRRMFEEHKNGDSPSPAAPAATSPSAKED